MPYTWDIIETKWSFGISIPYSKKEIIKAFNIVENSFGSSLFENYSWIRGAFFVTLIVDLGKILKETETGKCKTKSDGEIFNKIRKNDLYSVSTLIMLSAHYLRNGLSVEFEPQIKVKETIKRPDLRVKFADSWIYLEETKLQSSQHQKHIRSVIEKICGLTKAINQSINIEVILLRDDIGLNKINEIIREIVAISNDSNQPKEHVIGDYVEVYTYKKGQTKPSIPDRRPALCQTALRVGDGIECHINIQQYFPDTRIEKIIKKSKQLSPNECNIVLLDVSNELVRIKELSKSIKNILQNNMHRRISGVLLLSKSLFVESLEINNAFINHPNPYLTVPKRFIQLTNDYFKQFPAFRYRGKNNQRALQPN